MRPLRVGIFVHPPLINKCIHKVETLSNTVKCSNIGLSPTLLGKVLQLISIPYTLVDVQNEFMTNSYGGFNVTSGTWSGLLGLLKAGDVDTFASVFTITELRRKDFAFTYPVLSQKISYTMKKPKPEVKQFARRVFTTYTLDCYCAMMLVILLVVVLEKCYQLLRWYSRSQRIYLPEKLASLKSMSIMFKYFILLITGVYKASLLAELMIPPAVDTIDSMDKLINGLTIKEYRIATESLNKAYFERLKDITSNSDTQRKLVEALKNNPVYVESDIQKLLTKAEKDEEKYVIPTEELHSIEFASNHCGLTYVQFDENDGLAFSTFIFRRGQDVENVLKV